MPVEIVLHVEPQQLGEEGVVAVGIEFPLALGFLDCEGAGHRLAKVGAHAFDEGGELAGGLRCQAGQCGEVAGDKAAGDIAGTGTLRHPALGAARAAAQDFHFHYLGNRLVDHFFGDLLVGDALGQEGKALALAGALAGQHSVNRADE